MGKNVPPPQKKRGGGWGGVSVVGNLSNLVVHTTREVANIKKKIVIYMLIEEEKIYSPNKINISATRIYLKLFFK